MQNPDILKGLELVRQAVELDHKSFHRDALPLYKNAVVHFNASLRSKDTFFY